MAASWIIANSSVLNRFAALIKSGRLAHAYLFIGPESVGKSETALAVAKFVNCLDLKSEAPCETCAACIKINAGSHPDIHIIERIEKESISIEQIREMIVQIQLRPYEAKKKVFIIKNIEYLTPEGSNSLLKTLEEPSLNSLLLLTTSLLEKNLDTVKSRCHHIQFFPAPLRKLAGELKKDYAITESDAHLLSHFAQGCAGRAGRLHEASFIKKRNDTLERIVFGRDNEAYLKKILNDRQETKQVLDVLFSWVRDLLLLKSGAQEHTLIHLDRVRELRKLETQFSFEELKDLCDEVVEASGMLADNLNVKVALALIQGELWAK